MNFLIDYLTFSIRRSPDSSEFIHVEDLAQILHIKKYLPDFFLSDHGKARYYDHCYCYKGIGIYTTDYERGFDLSEKAVKKFYNQGISIEIKGEGCSFLENRPARTLLARSSGSIEIWSSLFCYLFSIVKLHGYSVNISRIDFAFDDICYIDSDELPKLSLDDIAEASMPSDDEFGSCRCVTASRYKRVVSEHCNIKRYDNDLGGFLNTPAVGRTIYFGQKESDCYCRFYDKLVEQSVVRKNEPVYLRDTLGKIKSWTRFEVVFKNKPALSLIWAFISLNEEKFSAFLAKTINGFIRFVVDDDSNLSRCSMCVWWEDFMLTAEHARIKRHPLMRNEFNRAVSWISRQVSTSAKAVADNQGVDFLLALIFDSAAPYKPKHKHIAECKDFTEPLYLSYDELLALKPLNL